MNIQQRVGEVLDAIEIAREALNARHEQLHDMANTVSELEDALEELSTAKAEVMRLVQVLESYE